jgi:hypothetical protein
MVGRPEESRSPGRPKREFFYVVILDNPEIYYN